MCNDRLDSRDVGDQLLSITGISRHIRRAELK